MTIYFARAVGLDRIKIGYVQEVAPSRTAAAVAKRLRQVGFLFGADLELLATTPGHRRMERWFHLRHASAALGREWFSASPTLMDDIAKLREGAPIDGAPDLAIYNHARHYREWREVERPDGTKFWLAQRCRFVRRKAAA